MEQNIKNSHLAVDLAGIKMKNPVMVASGTFGYGVEYGRIIDLNKLGAMVTKTITLNPRRGNPLPRILEVSSGMINSIGLQNVGLESFIKTKLSTLKKYDFPIIVSIAGETVDEYQEIASRLNKVEGIAGLELNLSCPNVNKGGLEFGRDPNLIMQILKKVKNVFSLPLVTKLPPLGADIKVLAKTAVDSGSDIISLINTVPAVGFYKQKDGKLNFLKGGLSGPAIKPIALRCVMEVREVVKCPLIGMGGIMNFNDALDFFRAGANAIAIGTANFVNPHAVIEIIEGLEKLSPSP